MNLKPIIIYIIFQVLLIHKIFVIGQDIDYSVFNVFLYNNFEQNTLGPYNENEWRSDWNNPIGQNRLDETYIYQFTDQNKVMRWTYPQGEYSPSKSGGQWEVPLNNEYYELYFSYDIYIKPGFNWVLGGKLPGVAGGPFPGLTSEFEEGFTSTLMWNSVGGLHFYIYHHDRNQPYGDGVLFDKFTFETGRWYNITMRVVINSIGETEGEKDGIVEGFIDNKLMAQRTNLRFRNLDNIGIDYLKIYSFFGGDADEYAAIDNEWIVFDNFILFNYKDNVNVPRGNTPSSYNRILLHPLIPYDDSEWKNSLKANTLTSKRIELTWDKYPVASTAYTLLRKESNNPIFTIVKTFDYNTTNYIDADLKPSTQYNYRIVAGNSNSLVITASTFNISPLSTPTNLSSQSVNKNGCSFTWNDNSSNEFGFLIEISVDNESSFKIIDQVNYNITTYNDIDLTPGTNYYYRIRAFNEDGVSPFSNILHIKTLDAEVPDKPTNLRSILTNESVIPLFWDDNSINETGFEIEKSYNNELFFLISTVSANNTDFTDVNIFPSTAHYYRVRAYNQDGYSEYSNTIVLTTNNSPNFSTFYISLLDVSENSIALKLNNYYTEGINIEIEKANAQDSVFNLIPTKFDENNILYDYDITPKTTYYYRAIAKDINTNFSSNIIEVTSISEILEKRVRNGLIAEYIFGVNDDNIIRDMSAFNDPLNLLIIGSADDTLTKSTNKITFENNTYIRSDSPAKKIVNACKETNELSIECWLKPEKILNSNSNIISLENVKGNVGFSINQELTSSGSSDNYKYYATIATSSTSKNGYPKFYLQKEFDYFTLHHLVLTKNSEGEERFYLNGEEICGDFRVSDFSNWDSDLYLYLGNDNTNNSPWNGSFFHFAIYNRELSADEIEENYNLGPYEEFIIPKNEYITKFYPNPVSNDFYVKLTPKYRYDYGEKIILNIKDIFGNNLFEKIISDSSIENELFIDLSEFNNGIYILYIKSEKEVICSERIIVIK